jgi:hypothetical protein
MAEFSYEADIAPMRGSYFSNSNLNDRERKQLQAGYMEKVAPYQEVTNKTLERMLDVQNQELSFQRANIAFEDEKLKLQEARDAAKLYPAISKQLEDAMEGKDPNDQRLLVSDIMMSNPTFFETKNGSALLSAVNSKISAGATANAVEQAKVNQVWNMAAQRGMSDIADQVSAGGLTANAGLSEISKRINEAEALQAQQEAANAKSELAYKIRTDYIDRSESLFNTIKYGDGSSDSFENTLLGDNKNGSPTATKPKSFAAPYRNALINRVINLSNLDPAQVEEVKKLPDNELHNLLGVRIDDNRTQLYRDVTGDLSKPIPTKTDLTIDDYQKKSWNIP